MAPERFHGRCDARSDVYALGLTLYEMLARRPAFDGSDRSTLMHQVFHFQPTRLRNVDASIPRDLETIVHKAIEKDPAHRYASAGAMAADLRCYLEDRSILARRATLVERMWRWSRRNRATAALAFVAAASLLTAAVVGWVGYATTMQALEGESKRRQEAESATSRADDNVALSLAVFDELFQRLAPRDTLPPPPLGISVRHPPPMPGPDGGPPRKPPPGPRRKPPPGAPRQKAPEADTALLGSVLTFYDRFATRNATNPALEGEAAWAYRKVGVLNERLGRPVEAEAAYARAIGILEGLVRRYPAAPEYRLRLVDTYDIVDPWSAESSTLDVMEKRLRRASELIDQLVAEGTGDINYAHAQVHVRAKLGMALQRLGRDKEAEDSYRQALDLEGAILSRRPNDGRTIFDRGTTRHALAMLLLNRGQTDQSKSLLNAAAAELKSLATTDQSRRPPPELFDRLADAFEDLGEPDRAAEISGWADPFMRKQPRDFAVSPDRPTGPPKEREGPP
jgi:tetratricopeptide (TPR) repeat protein